MAPNFLSKLVKSSPHNANRSLDSRSPSPGRSSTASAANSNGNTNPYSSPQSGSGRSYTTDSLTAHPSLTVIPPSPQTDSLHFPHTQDGTNGSHDEKPASVSSKDRRAVSMSAAGVTPYPPDDVPPVPPLPANGHYTRPENTTSDTSRTLKGGLPRALTPSSSTGNLREFIQQAPTPVFASNEPERTTQPPDIRRSSSRNSVRSHTISQDMSGHARAATTPAGTSLESDQHENGTIGAPLVESPTAINTEFKPSSSYSTFSDGGGNVTQDGSMLSPNKDNSDAVSVTSATSGGKKKNWTKSSLGRKRQPTGIAGALAASGLAMANSTMSAPHLTPSAMNANASQSQSNGTPRKASNATSHKATGSSSSIPKSQTQGSQERLPSRHSHRHPSISISDRSENFDSASEDASDGSESGSEELDLDAITDDIPVTGFAVASNKRNADFHELFPNIPEGDYLIEDYGCALQRDILVQGRLYVSENHICFHANIFGWITDLSIPIYDVVSLEKKMTAFVIPNAVQISTRQTKYTFASFLSRDTTFDVIFNIWRLARPDDSNMGSPPASTRGSLEATRAGMDEIREELSADEVGKKLAGAKAGVAVVTAKKATQCSCGKEGKHYSELAMETIIPGTPDKIYNLIFTSGFMKDFMAGDQKLLDIQISDWTPTAPGSKLLARNMSYIKPLNGSIGPKQTKCEIRDEMVYCDFDDYVVTVTTTRTPEVPSGGVFSVKTRTCITWASAVSTKVVVTTQVEWTGRSFIKGIIERSAIDGQKTYHADLDKAMRAYIQEHQSEFLPAGVDVAAVLPVEPASPLAEKSVSSPTTAKGPADPKAREHERNRRGLQWAWDTFEGASHVAKQSTSGALELITDAWDQSTSTTILIFVVVLLVFSNLWTLTMVGRREELGRRKEMKKTEEREKWVQGIVTALWDELSAGKGVPGSTPVGGDVHSEIAGITKTLDAIEERVRSLRETLGHLQDVD